jgi:hypothetical protein
MFILKRAIPKRLRDLTRTWRMSRRAHSFLGHEAWQQGGASSAPGAAITNPLREWFDSVESGPGVWKWQHYFDIYHRHLARFRNRDAHIVEVGVFGGGSLAMWAQYFGPGSHIYGVDINPACSAHQGGNIRISIGDQADRSFWHRFKESVPHVDILIDDGGHEPDQQIVTLEEMLPHIAPGGVYLCEDICGISNGFSLYVNGLAHEIHAARWRKEPPTRNEPELVCYPTSFQKAIRSIHVYPFVTVIEKHGEPPTLFAAPKHGKWKDASQD